jgi:repressor LexA
MDAQGATTMPEPLTEPQQNIYNFIRSYVKQEGRPPTNREIGQAVHIRSTGHVDHHLNALQAKGWIIRIPGKSRGIKLDEPVGLGLPIVGTIAAGVPLDYYRDTEQETLDLGAHTTGRAYVLQVKGDSMVDDHIASGDYVLINPETYYHDGDIVVATHLVAGEAGAATLKRYYVEKGRIRLQPANSEYNPIYITDDEWNNEWKIQGKVIAVYRQC